MNDLPIIEQLATTYRVKYLDFKDREFGNLKSAVEFALEFGDTITFVPWLKEERAPYTGSIERDILYHRRQ